MSNLDIKPSKPTLTHQNSSDAGKNINNTFKTSAKNNNVNLKIENEDILEYVDVDETMIETDAGSSGAFSAPLGMIRRNFNENIILKANDLFNIINESIEESEVLDETDTSSSGQYVTPAVWAKNPKKSKFSKKPFYKGGQFVEVKKKCKKFPYCNQSIEALKLSEETIKNIKIVSQKLNINEEEAKNKVLGYLNSNIKRKSTEFFNSLKKK